MHLKIYKPPLFNFSEILWFLDRGFDDCLHQVTSDSVTKYVETGTGNFLIKIVDSHAYLQVRVLEGELTPNAEQHIKRFVSYWLDLERDLVPFFHLTERDAVIDAIFTKYKGFRLIAIPTLFEALGWSIIGQQINLTFAYTLKRRLCELCGACNEYDGHKYYLFPKPKQVAKLSVEDLRLLQFSKRKAEYLIGVARMIEAGELTHETLGRLGSTEEMVGALCKIHGIGEWTANYAIMKSLKRMDCIPYGDVGLLKAIKNCYGLDKKPDRKVIEDFFSPFKGWESYVVFYLWRSLS